MKKGRTAKKKRLLSMSSRQLAKEIVQCNTVEPPKREQFGTKPSVHHSEVVCFQRVTIFIMLQLPIIVSVTIILFAVHSCIIH